MQIGTIYTILLTIYILTSLLIPLTVVNKLIFIVLFLLYGGYLLFFKEKNKFEELKKVKAPFLIVLIFGIGYVRGVFNGADQALAEQFLLATGILLLIYPINEFEIDMNRILKLAAKVYILFFAVFVIYAINVMDFSIPLWIKNAAHLLDNQFTGFIGETLYELCSGILTKRAFFGGSGMQIYLGTTPFLLILTDILFLDFLRNRKISNLFFVALSMLMTLTTGSRTLILLIPLSLCILIWAGLDRKKQLIVAAVIGLAGLGVFLYLWKFSTFFSLSEKSNYIKAGHLTSYFEQLNIKSALFGEGLGSFYYTTGKERLIAHTEITFMDHCRYFGIPLSILIWGAMIWPKMQKGLKEIKEELCIFLMYLFFAQTNPVLFNSFGLVAVLWYWNCFFKTKSLDSSRKGKES